MSLDLSSDSVVGINTRNVLSNETRHIAQLSKSTVRRRRLPSFVGYAARLSAAEQSELESISARSWSNCLFMGPLWGIELNSAENLQSFRREIRAELATQEEIAGRNIEVECSALDLLSDTSLATGMSSVPSLLITVSLGPGDTVTGKCTAQLLMCNEPAIARFRPSVVELGVCSWFSVVLTRGHSATLSLVLERFRLIYGGAYSDAGFSQDQMQWMAAMWTNSPRKRSAPSQDTEDKNAAGSNVGAMTVFTWETPSRLTNTPLRIRTEFTCRDIKRIWMSIRSSESNVLSRVEMNSFHSTLSAQLLKNTGIPLDQMDLVQLETPNMLVRSSGSVKFGQAELIPRCIDLFREFSREFFFGKI